MSRTYKKTPVHWFGGNVPKWFKRMNRQEERSKQNQTLKVGKEIPIFKKRDAYEFW